jgi:crossover junction endodeoxyribonuclease RuvC
MVVIGIDPGKSGGLAAYYPERNVMVAMPMLMTLNEGIDASGVRYFIESHTGVGEVHVFIERAQAMPKQGVVSMFNYGESTGRLHGAIMCASGVTTWDRVRPQSWKKALLPCKSKGKDEAIAHVELHHPEVGLVLPGCRKPHDGMADACCIAAYGAMVVPL